MDEQPNQPLPVIEALGSLRRDLGMATGRLRGTYARPDLALQAIDRALAKLDELAKEHSVVEMLPTVAMMLRSARDDLGTDGAKKIERRGAETLRTVEREIDELIRDLRRA